MGSENNSQNSPSGRRGSFSHGQTISEIFGGKSGPTSPQFSGPITAAAANAQANRRRMSLSAMSPTSPQGMFSNQPRRESVSSIASSIPGREAIDENAIDDSDASSSSPNGSGPFGRRVSFGARALRDVRTGSMSGSGKSALSFFDILLFQNSVLLTFWFSFSDGFNWSEGLKSKAESNIDRRASMSATTGSTSSGNDGLPVMPPPAPKNKEAGRPDAFQERILKGDFYMD
jgi:hypothetical protein